MQAKNLRIVEIAALTIAAVITVVFMLRAAEGKFDSTMLLFLVWAISPYICFFVAETMLRKLTVIPKLPLISCVVALLMLAFTMMLYRSSSVEGSSTGALIFLFAPLYLFIGSFALLIVGSIVAKLSHRSTGIR